MAVSHLYLYSVNITLSLSLCLSQNSLNEDFKLLFHSIVLLPVFIICMKQSCWKMTPRWDIANHVLLSGAKGGDFKEWANILLLGVLNNHLKNETFSSALKIFQDNIKSFCLQHSPFPHPIHILFFSLNHNVSLKTWKASIKFFQSIHSLRWAVNGFWGTSGSIWELPINPESKT